MKREPRKPLMTHWTGRILYAGIEDGIYFGGRNYEEPTQINFIDAKEARKLAKFLLEAADFLDHQSERGK